MSARTFEAWLDCRPEDLGIVVWDDGFLTSKSNRAKVFHSCFKEERPKRTVEDARAFCTQKIKKVCLSSANIVTKIIRMPMYIFDESLQKYEDMKIVHLIRDPRPTLLSQRAYGNFNEKNMIAYATRYCNRVLRDVLAAEFLEKKYPGRILTLFYEDLAKHTVKVGRQLYSFTGLNFTKDVELYIHNITKGKPTACDKGHTMCTIKSNSAALAEKWRDKIDFTFVQHVDEACKPLLYELRLKEIPTLKKLRDKVNFHLSLGPKPFDDFRWS